MTAVALCAFELGPYTVQRIHESDLYRVFLHGVLIGKCYSRPSESDCAWLHHQMLHQTIYAYSSAPLPELTGRRRNGNYLSRKRSRPSNP